MDFIWRCLFVTCVAIHGNLPIFLYQNYVNWSSHGPDRDQTPSMYGYHGNRRERATIRRR